MSQTATSNERPHWQEVLVRSESETAIGFFLESIFSPDLVEMAGIVGFDFVVIDLEHGPVTAFDSKPLNHAIIAGHLRGLGVVLRLLSGEVGELTRALDSGADALILPHVQSAADAQRFVEAARFPPIGKRSHGLVRAHDYGLDDFGFANNDLGGTSPEKDPVLIVLIEDVQGLDHIDEILAVDGIEMILLGVGDLRRSLEARDGKVSPEAFRDALDQARSGAKRNGIPWLVVAADENRAIKELQKGAAGVCLVDGPMIGRMFHRALSVIRNS